MYSWGDDTDDWAKPGTYKFDGKTLAIRAEAAKKAEDAGPRSYGGTGGPNVQMTSPAKKISSDSPFPLMVAVDVTGSMASWPAEIFDRLPLLYQTLSQYQASLEISFAAIGDAGCDRWPLQVTDFAQGFTLEGTLKALYGEGGGGDAPESYGVYAWWMNRRVELTAVPPESQNKPFLIVYGDAPMHEKIPGTQISKLLGENIHDDYDSISEWKMLCQRYSVWFLRRPTGRTDDATEKQWRKAVGAHFLHIHDEARAIDYALGIVAWHWGHLPDLRANMLARQPEAKVNEVLAQVQDLLENRR